MITLIATILAGIALIVASNGAKTTSNASATRPPKDWETITSTEWEFSAQLPPPIEQTRNSVATPYGNAPIETFASSMGPVRFTIAVAQYDPQVASEFTEQQRYESAAEETPKMLGGELVHNEAIQQGQIAGREHIINVPGKATLHSRSFLVGNRSYQIQVVYPSRDLLDPATEQYFLDSLMITHQPLQE